MARDWAPTTHSVCVRERLRGQTCPALLPSKSELRSPVPLRTLAAARLAGGAESELVRRQEPTAARVRRGCREEAVAEQRDVRSSFTLLPQVPPVPSTVQGYHSPVSDIAIHSIGVPQTQSSSLTGHWCSTRAFQMHHHSRGLLSSKSEH